MRRVLTILALLTLISLCGARAIAAQCGNGQFALVAVIAGNPFQAETVRTMILGEESSAPTVQKPGIVARDRLGRVRSEFVNGKYRMKTGEEVGKEVEWRIITICDPLTGTVTQLDPLGKTARIFPQSRVDTQEASKQLQNYCGSLLEFKNSHPDYEGLGHRTIEHPSDGRTEAYRREWNRSAGTNERAMVRPGPASGNIAGFSGRHPRSAGVEEHPESCAGSGVI